MMKRHHGRNIVVVGGSTDNHRCEIAQYWNISLSVGVLYLSSLMDVLVKVMIEVMVLIVILPPRVLQIKVSGIES